MVNEYDKTKIEEAEKYRAETEAKKIQREKIETDRINKANEKFEYSQNEILITRNQKIELEDQQKIKISSERIDGVIDPIEEIIESKEFIDTRETQVLRIKRSGVINNAINCINTNEYEAEIKKSSKYWSQAKDLINATYNTTYKLLIDDYTVFNFLSHRHKYHRHVKSHPVTDAYTTSDNGAPLFKINSPYYKTIVQLLTSEMNLGKDQDGNDKCYYYDFIFDITDKSIPICIKMRQMSNFHYPDKRRWNYPTKDAVIDSNQEVYSENRYSEIQIGFEMIEIPITDPSYNPLYKVKQYPKYIDRIKEVEIWTWEQYINTIPEKRIIDHNI